MGIGSVTDYQSFLQNYRTPEIPKVDIETVRKGQENLPVSRDLTQTAVQDIQTAESQRLPVTNAKLEDISLSFNLGEDYSYIGSDSDIASLDMEKAISDMKKDQVLQQYQYFVGSAYSGLPQMESPDGKVIIKE